MRLSREPMRRGRAVGSGERTEGLRELRPQVGVTVCGAVVSPALWSEQGQERRRKPLGNELQTVAAMKIRSIFLLGERRAKLTLHFI